MPVGTRGAISISACRLRGLGAEIVWATPTTSCFARVPRRSLPSVTGSLRGMGRSDPDRQRRVPGVLAGSQGDDDGVTFAARTTARRTASPRDRRSHAGTVGAETRCARRVPPLVAPDVPAGARTHHAWAHARTRRTPVPTGAVRIVQGGISEAMRAESAHGQRRCSSTGTASWSQRGGVEGGDDTCAAAAMPTCRPTAPVPMGWATRPA